MKLLRSIAFGVSAAVLSQSIEVRAASSSCTASINRENLVPCALEASLVSKAERQSLQAIAGREEAANPLLPSNPVLSVSAAKRESTGQGPVVNWYATLSQEVEIAGQRGARKHAVDAEREAQELSLAVTERAVAAAAWRAYFEVLSAREEIRLAEETETLTAEVLAATKAASDNGLLSGVEADLVEAAYLKIVQEKLAATRRERQSLAALASMIVLDPSRTVAVEGELSPIADVEAFAAKEDPHALDKRPEVQALEAAGRAYQARASLYRRARVPNMTVSVFVQNDGFNERVFGLGLSMPIPLPQPVGRTYAGEITEAEALSRRSTTQADRVRQTLRLDRENALASYRSARQESELYTSERVTRAAQSLKALATEIKAGRLAVRDAIVAEQALVELRRAALLAKKALALASVDLALAVGYPLDRGAP